MLEKKFSIFIVLTPAFDPHSGGVQMSTFKMSKYFASKAHKTLVFSFSSKGHKELEHGKLFFPLESGGTQNPKNLAHLGKVLQEQQPEVVINQMPYEHAISKVLATAKLENQFLLLGCLRNTLFSVKSNLDAYRKNVLPKAIAPLFDHALGRRMLLWKHKKQHGKDLKRILDVYDYFVMFGPPNAMELEYFVGDYKKEKWAFIPNSIPSVLPQLPEKEKTILYLSRLDYHQKRADLILPLWKQLHEKLPDWHMKVVGGGPALKEIQKQILEENLPRITVLGKQKPDEHYKKAAIYIMTSAFEGFPNTVIEAQSYGCVPIVFDSYPMASWVIHHGNSGFLVHPFDIEKMASTIYNLVQNKEKQFVIGQNALENARRFQIDEVGEIWLNFFKKNIVKNQEIQID